MKLGRGGNTLPFIVMDVIAEANAADRNRAPGQPRILRLEVGQPGTGAPEGARHAVQAALATGDALGYTEALGRASLRRRIAVHYRQRYGAEISPDRIAVTAGASGAFPLAFLACFDPGDRVALVSPYYPPYVNILNALGMCPVILPSSAAAGFQPTLDQLDALHPRPEGLIVASPCNPTGTMLSSEALAAIARWCEANDVRLISDEIYHGITFGAPPGTAASYSATAVVINSFSKYYAMTGWRIGWMVLPQDLVRPVERLAQNMTISAPHVSQIAAEAAFECDAELRANVARYRRSRDLLLDALPAAWFAGQKPEGAFYLYADLGAGQDSPAFCRRALYEIGVSCSPGLDFDAARGKRFVRFSYAGAEPDLAEAAARLKTWVQP